MKGRKPKPSVLKKLEGNPGKRMQNLEEAQVLPSIPTCPGHLNRYGREEWNRISKELFELGLLSEIDRAALAAYCSAYGRWVQVELKLKKSRLIVTTTNGNGIQNPLVGMANKLRHQVIAFAAEFGMTPSSRSRVRAEGQAGQIELEQRLFSAHWVGK